MGGRKDCFINYVDALLDCMLPERTGLYAGNLLGPEILFFGPAGIAAQ